MHNFNINDLVEYKDHFNNTIIGNIVGFPMTQYYPHLSNLESFVLFNDNISTYPVYKPNLTLLRSANDLFSICKGDIWNDFDELDYICVTTNSVLKTNGNDRVWGIGLYASDDRVLDQSKWKGRNLLGNVLMDIRKYFFNLKGLN